MRPIEKIVFNLAHEIQKPGFTSLYHYLKRHQWNSREKLIDEQNEKLRHMIHFCYDYIPYYRRNFKLLQLNPSDIKELSDLEKIPSIKKQDIIANKTDFYPRGFQSRFYNRTTGGTTGTPFSFRISHRVRFLSAALLYRCWASGGYNLGDRMLVFAGASLIPQSSKILTKLANEIGRNVRSVSSFNITPSTMTYCIELLKKWKPPFLRGYPSSLVEFANYIEDNNIDLPHLKAIFTTSENLFHPMREKIESVFETPVFDGYGANDGGVQSFECEHHNMHICTERSILEVVDDSNNVIIGKEGRILATDLENYAMPLIRYDLGDNATASAEECTCGRGLPLLDSLIGRTVSVFVTPTGKLIHGWFFLYLFWELGEVVRDYRVTQFDEYNIEILIVPGPNFVPLILEKIKEYTYMNCAEWVLEISLVDEISKTSSGKKIFIESKVKRKGKN